MTHPPQPLRTVHWRVRGRVLTTAEHTLVMGILNVTPDSFSDGGRFVTEAGVDVAGAIAAGKRLWADGADIVDVGGESTRPGAQPIDATTEIRRTIPVVAALAGDGVVVSIDTTKPEVAAAALDAGARIVNDVSGLRDPELVRVCAAADAGVVIMHMQGTPQTMQVDPHYDDVVAEVSRYLVTALERSGLDPATVCFDPGIGFGKTAAHNLELLQRLDAIVALGHPVLVGTSRKQTLGMILEAGGRGRASQERRDRATAATTALAVAAGAAVIRVHDVPRTVDVARTADAIVRGHIDQGDQ